ncbi:N-acetylmuramoyl-L-alanine amidase [Escherichia coli]|nr:N-acetylmuramoyl-L-alanine amidase [Escherichia coli]EIQ1873460.1 N-acetylmuramoyl-L-alanine amidase [Escherichia coli]EKF2846436.1 N-acetylmuramoyl-L-alanine amidase [Escherichia coli]MBB9163686.1 N-acetylmuramoyl-L-alanine amidase [Escherichia coli]HEI3993037.1 N-acetylmuramoyl-L-alanine amidase [Escherichia coli]
MSKNVILSNGERENPSPLIYDKHKKHCIFRTKTLLSEEKKEDEKCTVSVVFIDHEGYIRNAGIIKHTVPELEEGRMPKINAIILHRTDSSTINGTLASFSKGIGTHFIVEKDGNIYQAASLFVYTSHVGKIKSRCKEEKTWSSEEKRKQRHSDGMLRRYMIMKKLNNILIDIHIIWTVLALRLLHYMIKKIKNGSLLQTLKKNQLRNL